MTKARLFASKSFEEGNKDYNIGCFIYNSMRVGGNKLSASYREHHYKKAEMHFNKALLSNQLSRNDVGDMYNKLGIMYMRGLLGEHNYDYARFYFKKAISYGNEAAKLNTEALDKVVEVLPVSIVELMHTPGVW